MSQGRPRIAAVLTSAARLRRTEESGSVRLIEPHAAAAHDIRSQKGTATLSVRAGGSACAPEECGLGDRK